MSVNFTAQIAYPLSGLGIDVALKADTAVAITLLSALKDVENESNREFFDFEDMMPDSCIFGAQPVLAQYLLETITDLDAAIRAHLELAVEKNVTFSIDSNSHKQGFAVIRLNNEFNGMPELNMGWGTALDLLDAMGVEKPENESDGRSYKAQNLANAAQVIASSDDRIARHAKNLVALHAYLQSIGHDNAEIFLG